MIHLAALAPTERQTGCFTPCLGIQRTRHSVNRMPHKNTAPRVRSENQELKSKDAQQHPSTKVWKIKLPHCPLKRWWSSLNAGFTYNLLNLSFKCTTRSWAIFAQTSTFFHAILQDSQHITQSTWSDRTLVWSYTLDTRQ